MNYRHNPKLTENAKELRKHMTKEEKHLWYDFLKDHPERFLRQKVIDDYIADFYCHKAKLVIELDGTQHYEPEGLRQDAVRDDYLKSQGLTLLRIPNNAIKENFPGVCEEIFSYMQNTENESK